MVFRLLGASIGKKRFHGNNRNNGIRFGCTSATMHRLTMAQPFKPIFFERPGNENVEFAYWEKYDNWPHCRSVLYDSEMKEGAQYTVCRSSNERRNAPRQFPPGMEYGRAAFYEKK